MSFLLILFFFCILVAFVIILLFRLLYKKRSKLFWAVLIISLACIAYTFIPRSGVDIYVAMFGNSLNNCLKIIDKEEHSIPILDDGIYLHFKTCPPDVKRILSLHTYTCQIRTRMTPSTNDGVKWFKPETLGDSVIDCFGDKSTNTDYETFYISKDSTEVYYNNYHN